ncbi:arsenate reductase ArsC [Desulfohalovibrio reitneri]|uniref:arsenate reductase ArsC n=1 Tax=Desulfohalovibrio reitneri TaxID=1307759 RepID=UPI0004A6F0C8|nr:arsenate reductase ArsC [Desulfohalovibrio reitneri]
MTPTRVLFVGSRHGSRSRMAEAILSALAPGEFEAQSAGFETAPLDPLCALVLEETGLPPPTVESATAFSLFSSGRIFDHIITLCDDTTGERCPIYPGHANYLHWPTPDPDAVQGNEDTRLTALRACRDQLAGRIRGWLREQNSLKESVEA